MNLISDEVNSRKSNFKKGGELKMGDSKKGINPAAAGLAGAVIGAAAGAAAVVLSQPENRKRLGKGVKELRNRGEELRIQGTKKFEELRGRLEKSNEEVTNELETAEEKLQQSDKKAKS